MGVTPLLRKTKQVYQVAFSFKGVQCREVVDLPHSKANEKYCERLRAEILGKIARNDFKYSEYFPNSPTVAKFEDVAESAKKLLLKDLLTALKQRAEKTMEHSSYLPFARDIDNFLIPWCGHMDVRKFGKGDIRTWVGLQNTSLKRIRNKLAALRAVLQEAADDEIISISPFQGMDLARYVSPKQRDTDYEPEPYTTTELVTLLANLKGVERWTFQLWAFTGLRTGELCGLQWHRLDMAAKQVRIVETITVSRPKATPKTPSGVRTIPLLPAAVEAVEGMRRAICGGACEPACECDVPGERLFTLNPRGRRAVPFWDSNKLADVWSAAHRGTGIKPRNPYQLRHTFASQLLSQGENIAYIARLLGHKDTEMVTRTYGKWIEEGERLGFDRPPRKFGMAPLWA